MTDNNLSKKLRKAAETGTINGKVAAYKGAQSPLRGVIRANYKKNHPDEDDQVYDAYCTAYLKSYKKNEPSPEERAIRTGIENGVALSRRGKPLLSEENLSNKYERKFKQSLSNCYFYARSYQIAYKSHQKGISDRSLIRSEIDMQLKEHNKGNSSKQEITINELPLNDFANLYNQYQFFQPLIKFEPIDLCAIDINFS